MSDAWHPNENYTLLFDEDIHPGEFLKVTLEGPMGALLLGTGTEATKPVAVTFWIPPNAVPGGYRVVECLISSSDAATRSSSKQAGTLVARVARRSV
jgi:hypothetical protein